jgi:methylated-DNA-protein-cysteine methyltransferase-like protein
MPTDFTRRVSAAVRRLRRGEVATYGEIAEEAGFPDAARAVGNVLASVDGLPWWRVVRADGLLTGDHGARQARLLQREGIVIERDRVGASRLRSRRGQEPRHRA